MHKSWHPICRHVRTNTRSSFGWSCRGCDADTRIQHDPPVSYPAPTHRVPSLARCVAGAPTGWESQLISGSFLRPGMPRSGRAASRLLPIYRIRAALARRLADGVLSVYSCLPVFRTQVSTRRKRRPSAIHRWCLSLWCLNRARLSQTCQSAASYMCFSLWNRPHPACLLLIRRLRLLLP